MKGVTARPLLALAAVLAVLLPAGCVGEPFPRWQELPASVPGEAVTLTPTDGGLLVGSYAADAPVRPRLDLLGPDGRLRRVPATPAPGYGAQARWVSVAVDGSAVTAVGGARGGAHGNVRWTQWSGDLTGVRDLPQSFWTFGGHEAGDVVGAAYVDGRPLLVGGWASPRTGFDVATYELSGRTWVRTSPGGPALASTPAELVSASALASDGRVALVVGSATRLTPELPVRAVLWRGTRDATGRLRWTRTDLPGASPAEALGVGCAASAPGGGPDCLVVGRRGGRLALWPVRGGDVGASVLADVPVPDGAVVLPPARGGRSWAVVVRSGATARLVVGDGDGGWRTGSDLPPGTPVALAGGPGGLRLATVREGHTVLWAADEGGRS